MEVARALIVKPDLLYMDEPCSRRSMPLCACGCGLNCCAPLQLERHTTLLVTHDVEEAIHLDLIPTLLRRRGFSPLSRYRFPHPRKLSSPEVGELKEEILRELGVESDIVLDVVQ